MDEYERREQPYSDGPVGQPRIRVVGVGGAGVNAVNRMVEAEVEGVEFLAVNTDQQSLQQSTADITLHIGAEITRGLGSGSDASVGRQAAMEDYDRVKALLKGSDMIFITAGAGGGTGTGAAPIVARIAREVGALTVAIVTKPFGFEGSRRCEQAEHGIAALGRGGRHADRRPQRPPAERARQADRDGRGLSRRRRRAAPGRAGHLRPRHPAGPHQPRLRRRAHDHVRRRRRPARDRHGRRRRAARGRRRDAGRRLAAPGNLDGRRALDPALHHRRARPVACGRSTRPPRPSSEAAHPDANIIFGAMVDEKLDDQVWVTVVATGYGDARRQIARDLGARLREPAGEPRVRRTSSGPPRPAHAQRRATLAVDEMEVPEFMPRVGASQRLSDGAGEERRIRRGRAGCGVVSFCPTFTMVSEYILRLYGCNLKAGG